MRSDRPAAQHAAGKPDRPLTRSEMLRRRRRRTWWPTVTLGARIIAAVMAIVVVIGAGYTWATFRSFVSNVTQIDAIVPPTPLASGAKAQPAAQDLDGSDENILLVGDDHRPDGASAAELAQLGTQDDDGSNNTDTMMVLHIPADGSRATIISFPRDSWVNIPGYGMDKLNSAFSYGSENGGGDAGGARLLIQTIQSMTGLTIDHFVRVSLLGFYDIAQALGPIKVCLNEAAQDSYSAINLPAGVSYLNASQALAFVRQRHNLPRGDLDREVRQQYFLAAAFRKVESAGTLLNPLKLNNLLSAVSSSLETDPGLDLLKFAEQFENLSAGNVTYSTIPITGTPTITVDGSDLSIVAVDTAAMPGFIAKVIGSPTAYVHAKAAAPSATSVTVINASNTEGAADSASATLQQAGFHTGTPGSADSAPITFIEYPTGMEAQAKAVAAYVPNAPVTNSASVTGVTLVLGSDGLGVTVPTPPGSVSATPAVTPSATPTAPSSTASAPVSRTFSDSDCIN